QIMEGLPAAVIIHRRPTGYGPAIIVLPKDAAHGTRHILSPIFRGEFDAVSLKNLTEPQRHFEIFWRLEIARGHVPNLLISFRGALVPFHDGSDNGSAVRFGGVRVDRRGNREGLKTKLTRETG